MNLQEIKTFFSECNFYDVDPYYVEQFSQGNFSLSVFTRVLIKEVNLLSFLEIPFCMYGDYIPCSIYSESNYRSVSRDYSCVYKIYGGFGFHSLFVRISELVNNLDLRKVIIDLFGYPIYDEDDYFKLENEKRIKLWEDSKNSFIKNLIKLFPYLEDNEDNFNMYKIFNEITNLSPECIFEESNYYVIDLEKLFSSLSGVNLNFIVEKWRIKK